MAKKFRTFTVLISGLVHDLVERAAGEVIKFEDKVEHNDTIRTLIARGYIKEGEHQVEEETPDGGEVKDDAPPAQTPKEPTPDPAMAPAAIATNDGNSQKVDVSSAE